MYVEKITIKETYRNLETGFELIPKKDVTLLVGDQGCGKSSLLTLLKNNSKEHLKLKLHPDTVAKGTKTFYFDTESMNPRVQDLYAFTNPNGTSKGLGLGAGLASRFQSHGEVLQILTIDILEKASDCVLFLDEPESGLSLRNQYRFVRTIKRAVQKGCQFFIATHCVPIIEAFEEVYDLENKKWVNSIEYVNSFKNEKPVQKRVSKNNSQSRRKPNKKGQAKI